MWFFFNLIFNRLEYILLGADGLVKLWTVKTNECIATYDQHEDKVMDQFLFF